MNENKKRKVDTSWKAKMVEQGIYKDREITSEEKQIEELTRDIIETQWVFDAKNYHKFEKIAKELVAKGWVLSKNSVVLSREEYDCLKRIEKSYDPFWFCSFGGCEGACKECKDTCEMSIFVKERKETAEKFARDIFKHITTPEVWEKLRQQWLSIDGNFNANKLIYNLLIEPVAKQFSVEIKE